MSTPWAILTGEYPPQPGGVSDYTRQVAEGLARAGDEVHVWASRCEDGGSLSGDRVTMHRLPDHFGPAGLAALDAGLARLSKPYRILVQYVPHAFGYKAMNLPFCFWLGSRRRDEIWAMFHEVQFPFSTSQALRHNVLAGVTHVMARSLARAADQIFISIPAWAEILRPMLLPEMRRRPMTWLPVPSNVATTVGANDVRQVRQRLTGRGAEEIVGHFGTFGPLMRPLVEALLPALVQADPGRVALLLGRGSEAFAAEFAGRHPALRDRIHAAGELPGPRLAAHLAACDVLVQPYPDGLSARRGTLMAALALGVPLVTNAGPRTESIWKQSEAVALVPSDDAPAMIAATEALLADAKRRQELSGRAKALYAARFTIDQTIAALRTAAGQPRPEARARKVRV